MNVLIYKYILEDGMAGMSLVKISVHRSYRKTTDGFNLILN